MICNPSQPVGIFCFEGIVRILDQYLDIVEPHLDRIMERMDRIEPHLPYILLHLASWARRFFLGMWVGQKSCGIFWGTQKNGHYGGWG